MRVKKGNKLMIRSKNILLKWGILFLYETRVCIDLIFALVINYTFKAIAVVELSLSRF